MVFIIIAVKKYRRTALLRIADYMRVSTDVKTLDKKLQNRIEEVKKIYIKIDGVKKVIAEKVGSLEKEIKALEKQTEIFEKELIPVLKQLEDHAIQAEGVFIELKSGKRSPKVGYDYLAEKVNSELLRLAEEAMTKAAEFAQKPTIKVATTRVAGIIDFIKAQWDKLVKFVSELKKGTDGVGKLVSKLDAMTK